MTFNQINYFLAVARYLNFTQAASELFVAQSTLSRSIASLESEIGVPLLERDFHNVTLTPAGELMYSEMQNIMGAISAVVRRVQAIGNNEGNKLVIGILEGQEIDAKVLYGLKKLSDNFDDFDLEIRKMLHQELINEVKAGKLDIAETVLTDNTPLDEEIGYLPLKRSGSYLAARSDDPIWCEKLSLSALNGRVLLTPQDYHMGSVSIDSLIQKAGINVKIKATSDMESQSLWVEAGLGVTICNVGHVIYTSQKFKQLSMGLIPELPEVSIGLLWNKGHPSSMVKKLLKSLSSGVEGESEYVK